MKKENQYYIIISALIVVILVILGINLYSNDSSDEVIGGDRDTHGCLVAAGYSWSDSESECVREWLDVGDDSRYQVNSFQSCVDAGYNTMESFPRGCKTPSGRSFTEELSDGDKKYVNTAPERCALIQFLCLQGYERFDDDQGCGCQKIAKDEADKVYCLEEWRNAEACFALYAPVCGWNDPEKIQCIKYPCASTYGNSCEACANENVEYYTSGECPA